MTSDVPTMAMTFHKHILFISLSDVLSHFYTLHELYFSVSLLVQIGLEKIEKHWEASVSVSYVACICTYKALQCIFPVGVGSRKSHYSVCEARQL